MTDLDPELRQILDEARSSWGLGAPPPQPPEPDDPCARARASVPRAYRWVRNIEMLRARVPDYTANWTRSIVAIDAPRVVFQGPAGSGKTSLATALLLHLLDVDPARGPRARFVHAHGLGVARQQFRLGEGEAPLVDTSMRASVLLLDDLGNERRTELSSVPDVVFERHAEERPTWVTTAFSPAEIAAKYGDGIARRVFERATVIRLGGQQT